MSSQNNVIQSLWIGGSLSRLEQLSITSFLKNGHTYHLYTYGKLNGVPEGTIVKDANDILPADSVYMDNSNFGSKSFTGFSDLFRIAMLHKVGGWWVDTDVICLRPFEFDQDVVICTSYENNFEVHPNNCILKFPAGHFLLKYMLDEISKKDLSKLAFAEIGPLLMIEAVRKFHLQEALVPFQFFNPIAWYNVRVNVLAKTSLKESVREKLRPVLKPSSLKGRMLAKDSYAVHLWNQVWRESGYGKDDAFAPNSLYEKLKKKYQLS